MIVLPILLGICLLAIFILMGIATFKDAGIVARNNFNFSFIDRKYKVVHKGFVKILKGCDTC